MLYVFGFGFLILASIFSFRKWTSWKNTRLFYFSIVELYFKARSRGLQPNEACLAAIEERYPRAENIKTKVYTMDVLNSKSASGKLPEDERQLVTELVKTAASIQSKLELETSSERREQIIESCFNDLKEAYSKAS
ncbi:MAG: hypothetical protein AB8G05_07340 [Oligoflexales bacterium]